MLESLYSVDLAEKESYIFLQFVASFDKLQTCVQLYGNSCVGVVVNI